MMTCLRRSGPEGDTTGFVDWKTQKENTSSVVNCILTSTQKYPKYNQYYQLVPYVSI